MQTAGCISAGCNVGDDVFYEADIVTEMHAGICQGVVRPRT